MKQIHVGLTIGQYDTLKAESESVGLSMAAIVKLALNDYFKGGGPNG